MGAVQLHLNVTCYAQHPSLKLIDEKRQSVMGKLLSSCWTVFELTQGVLDSTTNDLNCSYEALV